MWSISRDGNLVLHVSIVVVHDCVRQEEFRKRI